MAPASRAEAAPRPERPRSAPRSGGHGGEGRGPRARHGRPGRAEPLGTGAGPAEGRRGGAGHRAVAERPEFRRAGESGRCGLILHQRRRHQSLRLPGRAQLPGPRGNPGEPLTPGLCPGAVRGLPDGDPHCPLRGRIPGLPRGPFPGGSCSETSAGAAQAQTSGASGRWEWGAPSQRIWCGLSPRSPDGSAVRWSGQEPPAGGWLGQGRAAQGADPFPAEVRRYIPTDRHFRESPGHGACWVPDVSFLNAQALRSYHNSSKPLYVSVGHRVSLDTAVRLVGSCCRYRVPEPIRQADIRSREYIRKQLCPPLEVRPAGPESSKKEAELEDYSDA
ncbi:endonuclease V isoform X6 [Myiozetetes cayanensis]|uniref:endonuclease V isoform X6 n=1 Tax=Myiozetetes cayanensis TaxID=478635 RepID=UPI00215FAE78|nr:endonuclease V isoform X6 [Myiozetetes cayanensis]